MEFLEISFDECLDQGGFFRHVARVLLKFQAGSETTVTFLKFLILYMVNFPSVQSRLQEEVDRVVGRDRGVFILIKIMYRVFESNRD